LTLFFVTKVQNIEFPWIFIFLNGLKIEHYKLERIALHSVPRIVSLVSAHTRAIALALTRAMLVFMPAQAKF